MGYARLGRRVAGGSLVAILILLTPLTPTATAWGAVVLEAEYMPTKTTGGATSGGWCIWANGYIQASAAFPSTGEYEFVVRARGKPALGVWPNMQLRINQQTVASTTVNTSGWSDFTLTATVSAGTHNVAIAFTNDYYSPSTNEDRNLYVDKVTIDPVGGGPPPDTTPPVISSVSISSVDQSSAVVSWTTDEPATSLVEYGTSASYGQIEEDEDLSTSHQIALDSLTPQTLYHVRIHSTDAADNEAVSGDATFTTASPADATPPSGSVLINGGAVATNTPSVMLTLSATDDSGTVVEMQLSADGVSYGSPEPFATSKAWTLGSGDGSKSIHVRFSDAAGNWSVPASDSIVLDTTPPVLSIMSPLDGAVITAP